MKLFFKIFRLALITPLLLGAVVASAQSYPSKPIKFIVPYPPGGPLDTMARLIGQKMADSMGQPVVVENKPGAGGNIGADLVAKSPADGYTILLGAVATHAINPTLYASIPYDPVKDFAPITLVAKTPNVLVVNPGVKASSVKEFIELAKASPGKLNFASGSTGSAGHLAGELFNTAAGVNTVHIPYKGAAAAVSDLLAGQVQFMFDNLASATPHIKTGKLRPLAVTTAKRAQAMPELPTMAEAGLSSFDINTWAGVFAPAATPKDVVARLHAEITKALASADVAARIRELGAEPVGNKPEEFAAYIQTEIPKYAKIIKASGAKVD